MLTENLNEEVLRLKWRAEDRVRQVKRKLGWKSESPTTPPGVRLNLGCGDKILPGYVNVDIAPVREGKSPDVLSDLRQLPFADGHADEVLSVHVIEHFYHWEAVEVLKEWVRVLKPGGTLILECPNLLTAAKNLVRQPHQGALPGLQGQSTMWVLYGDPAWKDPLMCHKWGYTPQSLGQLMQESGLVDVRRKRAVFKLGEPRDMRVVGVKPKVSVH